MFGDIARMVGKMVRLEDDFGIRTAKLLEGMAPDVREMLGGLAKPGGFAASDMSSINKALARLAVEAPAAKQGNSPASSKVAHVLHAIDVQMKISIIKLRIRELEQELDRLLREAGGGGGGQRTHTNDEALSRLRKTAHLAAQSSGHQKVQAVAGPRNTMPEHMKLQEQAQNLQNLMDSVSNMLKQQHDMNQTIIRNMR
jgi:hypothetical protein